jgi:hypothetical protein
MVLVVMAFLVAEVLPGSAPITRPLRWHGLPAALILEPDKFRCPGRRVTLMMSILVATLLSGLPEVTIKLEQPGSVYLVASVTNKTDRTIAAFFGRAWNTTCFEFHFFDERGRPVVFPSSKRGQSGAGRRLVTIKPGETAIESLSPTQEYAIRPGRYQVEVSFRERGKTVGRGVRSNRITMTFP